MRSLLPFASLMLFLVSCSGKAPVKTGFQLDLSGLTSAQGGLVIFGHSTDGDRFTRVISTSAGSGLIQEEIPKGVWSFGAVAWAGSKGFTGTMSCAFQSSTTVEDDEVSISLKLLDTTCVDSNYAVSNTFSGAGDFADIYPNVCQGDVTAQGTTDCTYSETIRPIVKGFAGSYKMFIPAMRKIGNSSSTIANEYLESSCYNIDTNSEPVTATYDATELNIPVFKASVQFPLQVLAYLGSACEDAKGVMPRNLTIPSQANIVNVTPGVANNINISASIPAACTVSQNLITANTNSPAAGNGTEFSPWLICTEEQLKAVQEEYDNSNWWSRTPTKSGVFVLGRDMNLLKFVQFGAGTTPAHQCLEMGDTFVPMGKIYDGYPSCNLMASSPISSFRFDGDGHTISHFRFKSSLENNVGFVSSLSGKIHDVNFDRTEIEAADYAGAVAGNTTGGEIKMVRVTNSFIEAKQYTGGVAGDLSGSTSLYMIFGKNLDVEGTSSTGGLFGKISTSSVTDASFDGSVYAENGSSNVGGIVGFMQGPSLNNVAAKGILRGAATNMGGIAGSSQTINYARSEMYIKDYDSTSSGTRNIGGIVGFQGAAVTNKSYFGGTIHSNCNSGTCNIGSIAGDGGTPVDSFSTFSDPSEAGQAGDDTSFGVDDVFVNNNVSAAMCNGMGGCPWTQVAGGKPLLNSFEGSGKEPTCSQSPNTLALAAQANTPHFRGTSANPLVICRPDQFKEIPAHPTKYFVIEDHLNLNALTISDMGIFDGYLNGKQHYIHSFWDLATTADASLFTTIDTNAEIKNLQAVGFHLAATTCSTSCKVAPLALQNDGDLINIRIQDFTISALNANTQTGGMVSHNNGQIRSSRVDGDMKSFSSMGGMVYSNVGTILESLSDVYIDSQDNSPSTYIGGIAASNNGVISRSKFRGEMVGLASSIYVGGIAGISAAGTFTENEFDSEAIIRAGASSQSVGGIVGRFSSTGLLTRNLVNGTILSLTSTDVLALAGSGAFTNTNNFRATVPGLRIETAVPSAISSYNGTSKVCIATVTGSVGNGNATVPGILSSGGEVFHGLLADSSMTYTFTTLAKDSSQCNLLSGSVDVYAGLDTKDAPTISSLKTAGWDIGDLAGSATDINRVYATYKSWLTNTVPASPPVWINDPDEDGLSLFMYQD